jgi:hypothetical protein
LDAASRIHERYHSSVQLAISKHISDDSRRTYGTGIRAFFNYCASNSLEPDLSTPGITKRDYAIYFAFFLYSRGGRTSTTVSQYISHVIEYLVHQEFINDGSEFRSTRLRFMLAAYARADSIANPLRLRQRIPGVFVIICEIFLVIDRLFPFDTNSNLSLKAATSAGYGISLRPQEYLAIPGKKILLSHQINTTTSTFWWGDSFWYCYDLNGCGPIESVTHFGTILDFNKNHALGDGGPRAIAAAPAGAPFCMVKTLLEYFLTFPASIDTPLLVSHGPQVDRDKFDSILKVVALNLNLPPSKLTPASLRAGAPNQLSMFSDEHRCLQGGWKTISGMRAYMRQYLGNSAIGATALYDSTIVPLSHLRYTHRTQLGNGV